MSVQDSAYLVYVDAVRTSEEVVLQYDAARNSLSTWIW